jgi:hypothetical protein
VSIQVLGQVDDHDGVKGAFLQQQQQHANGSIVAASIWTLCHRGLLGAADNQLQ